jgi:DeoR family glycerol-3-phosphate regulon repressor
MYLAPRHTEIIELAKTEGRVLVDDLAQRFDVTPQTIRKDLNDLCERQLLTRIHGGAVIPSSTQNMEYAQRGKIAAEEKQAIGAAAAALIPDNASLFINIGTTTEAVSQALLRHGRLMIITNNINVANRMRPYTQFEVVIAGGVVRALLDYEFREVKVAQAIIANARQVILVADSTKFERTAPVRIGHLEQVDTFVTDQCPDDRVRKICGDFDVELIETMRLP